MTVQAPKAGVAPAVMLTMPVLQQTAEGIQQADVDVNPVRQLGEALLTKLNRPASMMKFGHVALVPVPGGLAIRLKRAGLPLEAPIKQIPSLRCRLTPYQKKRRNF